MLRSFAAALLLLILACACTEDMSTATSGDQSATAQSSTTVTASGGSSSVSSSSSSSASSGTSCSVSGGTSWEHTRIVAKSANGDTLSLTFDHGVPPFQAMSQPSSHFTASNGASVDLTGSAGVLIILFGMQAPGDPAGAVTLTSQGARLSEVRRIGDAGGQVTLAVALRTNACPSATVSGSTLTFRFA